MIRRLLLVGGVISSLSAVLFVLDSLYPPDFHRYKDVSRIVYAADETILRIITSSDEKWRLPARVEDVDPRYIAFLVAYEDKRFWTHYGVDPLAIARALRQWSRAGRIVSGASTITMQVVRLLEPRPRTLLSKSIEIARAVQLEMKLSKQDILSIYLTLAPFGGNIEGIKAASLAYLDKIPRQLTVAEAALLVALPQSPSLYRPDRHIENAKAARARVLKRLLLEKIISSIESVEAKNSPMEEVRHHFPFLAPHLARRLLQQRPGLVNIRTHIIPEFQAAATDIVGDTILRADPGVNVAAIIVENKTANVLAYVASSDFFDTLRNGQVDYIQAIRSPGSALKPFIYAMAFDEGIAHPETFLSDRKKRFGGYRPVNFDGFSRGMVTARHALQKSLNVPAVTLLNELGPRRFLSRLNNAGVHPILKNVGLSPGLAVALGGVGVSLEQLVAMYGALARGGVSKNLSLSKDQPSNVAQQFFDQKAAVAVSRILKGTPRPQGRYNDDASRKVAFKTGTSSGYRDALALGFDNTYTVGVWVGHPQAKPMPGKTGLRSAAPVLFRIFDFLPVMARISFSTFGNSTQMKAPKNLRTLVDRANRFKPFPTRPFSISFPVDGSKILNAGVAPVYPIKVRDGERPFNVLINGKPIRFGSLARSVAWRPKEPGFYSIVAIDRAGNVAASNVELLAR
jgi:penicillin-binding protein 1C